MCYVGENIEIVLFGGDLSQFIDHDTALLVKDVEKILEDFEMKGRCQ